MAVMETVRTGFAGKALALTLLITAAASRLACSLPPAVPPRTVDKPLLRLSSHR